MMDPYICFIQKFIEFTFAKQLLIVLSRDYTYLKSRKYLLHLLSISYHNTSNHILLLMGSLMKWIMSVMEILVPILEKLLL